MPRNTLLTYFFSAGSDVDPEKRFDLSRRSRMRRLRKITSILRRHNILGGFTPVEFRELLEDMGPSFIKVGQTLSTRSEILPKAYRDELSKLQMQCEPLPFEDVLNALDTFYDHHRDDVFASIDPTPLGSASLAQVHKATLHNGDVVAIKVQRPGVRATMAQDIDVMRMLARHASFFIRDNQMVDLRDVVEELWQTFLEETDFSIEAANLAEFARLNKDVAFITCPKPYPEYSNESVLVMEYVDGISIRETETLRARGYNLEEIGEKILDNYATQILDHGFFHADPHPGNIFIKDGKIVYIDLGIMGRFNARDRAAFGKIIAAVGTQNASKLRDALLAFAVQKDNAEIDQGLFLANIDLLLQDYATCDVADIDIGAMLTDIVSLTRQCKVTLPSSITMVSRGIVTIEGTLTNFVGSFNIVDIINKHIQNTRDAQADLEDSLEEAAIHLAQAAQSMVQAAGYTGETMRMITRGQLKVNMEVLGSEVPLAHLGRIVNRLTIGLMIAGLFVGSSLMAQSSMEPRWLGVPVLSFFGYLGAFILSVWVIVDIARKK